MTEYETTVFIKQEPCEVPEYDVVVKKEPEDVSAVPLADTALREGEIKSSENGPEDDEKSASSSDITVKIEPLPDERNDTADEEWPPYPGVKVEVLLDTPSSPVPSPASDSQQTICELCKKPFKQSLSLNHEQITSNNQPFHCKKCRNTSKSKAHSLSRLRRSAKEELNFTCDVCKKNFSRKANLELHMRLHTNDRPFACQLCDKRFTRKHHMLVHSQLHTGDRRFPCTVCEKPFKTASHLQIHMRVHTGEKPFTCEVCDKQFAYKSHFTEHKRIHTGEKPFPCDLCERKFPSNSQLRVHKRTHTVQKPYKCESCGKEFAYQSLYVIHRRMHTGDKPFSCDLCEKTFTCRSHMVVHKRIHTGEKPWTCDLCTKHFTRKADLAVHKKAHKDGRLCDT